MPIRAHASRCSRGAASTSTWKGTPMEHTMSSTGIRVRRVSYARHAVAVRLMHWINVVALTILFMSGLNIFNAHPALYWGKSSYTGKPALLEMNATQTPDGHPVGMTRIGNHVFDTTGVLG